MAAVPGQGSWPVESVTLYVYFYYPTNGINEEPSYSSNMLADYNTALSEAQAYIMAQGNEGVCVIQPITCNMVFPYKPWEDF